MGLTQINARDASVAILRKNNEGPKRPVYFIKFGLVTGPLGTNSQVLPNQYATGPIKNPTMTRKRYLSAPTSAPNTINPLTGKSTISSIMFTLSDINGEITAMVSSYTLKNRICTIYKGYEDIDEQYYSTVYVGQVNNWIMTQDGTGYTFTITDPLKQLNTDILKGHTQLVLDFNAATDQVLFVTSSFYFAPATDLQDGQGSRNYLLINSCLFSYTGKGSGILTDNTVTWQYIGQGIVTATTPQWAPNTAYVAGNKVFNLGNIYKCVLPGTSSGTGTGPSGFGSTSGAFYGLTQVILGANGSPSSQIHQAGSSVENYVLYQGNPIDIILQIALSTGTGQNYSGTGTNYDVLPAGQGIGIPFSQVNVANFLVQKSKFVSWMQFSNYFTKQTTALKFFQDHIFQQAQLYLFNNKAGQLDVKLVYYPIPTTDFIQIDDSNIIGIPQFNASLQTGNNFLNEIDVEYDFSPVGDFYANQLITIGNTSQQTYEESSVADVPAMFVNSQNGGGKIAARIANILLKRFGTPLPIITVDCFAQLQVVNPGDSVLLASSQVPNLKTGKRGGSVLCECLASAPDFQNDKCRLTLFATGYSSNKRYAVIGPAGMPNYTLATSQQQNYAFLSKLVQGNSSVGQMSDGTDGYYIPG